MRRVLVYSAPFLAVAATMFLAHAANRAIVQRPKDVPPAVVSSGVVTLASFPAELPTDAAEDQIPQAPIPPQPATIEPPAISPPAPEPPVPFDDLGGWLPLADASPAVEVPATEDSTESDLAFPQSESVQEILRIREKLRINPFEGTVIEHGLPEQIIELSRGAPSLPANCPSGNDAFVAALRKVTLGEEPETIVLEAPNDSETYEESEPYTAEESLSAVESPSLENIESVENDVELAAALRAACRALESRANHHEDLSQYERADDLRSLADQLRRESRRIDSPGEVARRR